MIARRAVNCGRLKGAGAAGLGFGRLSGEQPSVQKHRVPNVENGSQAVRVGDPQGGLEQKNGERINRKRCRDSYGDPKQDAIDLFGSAGYVRRQLSSLASERIRAMILNSPAP